MRHFLDFERPIADLERKIDGLRATQEPGAADPNAIDIDSEVHQLQEKVEAQIRTTYAKLTAWQKTQVARHPERPKALAYIAALITDYTAMAGDRAFADDAAIVGGLGRYHGRPVVVLGTERGTDTESRVAHNFGMARPEGYRKARRLIELAGRFRLPLLTFVDTAGAFPGIDAEARGQGEAIARAIEACLESPIPIIATIIGEGGSGGAIALAAGDRVLMLEHSVYSVISPEGCASILWRDKDQAAAAADAMRLTAQDLRGFGIADQVIPEPTGGAHRDPAATLAAVDDAIQSQLTPLLALSPEALRAARREKYLAMGRDALAA